MADFSKFKIGSTSYNVKDVNAGKSLSLSGKDLSLKNAVGNTISTVTLPSGDTSYSVVIDYTDTTVRGSYSNAFDVMSADTGTWSIYDIYPALPAGAHLSDVHDHITYSVQVNFPNAAPGYKNVLIYNTVTASSHPIFFIPKLYGNAEIVGCVVLDVNEVNSTIFSRVYTSLASGSSGSSSVDSINILCTSTNIWTVASANPVTIPVNDVVINGQGGGFLDDLMQSVTDKLNNNPSKDLKISITGQDWSAEILNYYINASTVTIYFEVCSGGVSYRKYASISTQATSLSLAQAQ